MPEEWRTYKLIRITGWTLQELDETPARICDWILRLHTAEEQDKADREAKRRKAEQG